MNMKISGSIQRTEWKFRRSVASRKSPSPFTFQHGTALPGFGCMPLRTRFFHLNRPANGGPYGSQSSSVPAYSAPYFVPLERKARLGTIEEQFP